MIAASVREVASRVRRGDTLAVEEVAAARAACEQYNPDLNAFVSLDWEAAMRHAARVDGLIRAGDDPGPLAGVPFGVKDLQHAVGFVTGRGSFLHANDRPAAADSPSIERLRAAGAIPIGKTATAEFGMDSATTTSAYGTTRNPWARALTPGGSSGGSAAAVSAGIVPFATGTDEGGSIRSPASFCGLVGLKSTHGLVPRDDGCSDTNVIGVLTRTVADTALLLDVLAGPHPLDKMTYVPGSESYLHAMNITSPERLRACWSPDLGYAAVEPHIVEHCKYVANRLARAANLELEEVRLDFEPPPDIWMRIVAARFLRQLTSAAFVPQRESELGPAAQSFIEFARRISVRELADAEAARVRLEQQVGAFFNQFDLLLTPTVACDPFNADGPVPETIAGRPASLVGPEPFTMLANLSWIPAISVPAGLTVNGLPVGLHIHAPWGRDGQLLALARLWEQQEPWPPCAPGYGPIG